MAMALSGEMQTYCDMFESIIPIGNKSDICNIGYYIAENMGSVPAVKIKTAPTKAKNMVYQKNYDFILEFITRDMPLVTVIAVTL